LHKIRRRAGKTIGAVSQEFVDVTVSDESGREMEIISPWVRDYSRLREGMRLHTLVASPSRDFSKIAALSEAFVPSCGVWIGDYPFLDKEAFVSAVIHDLSPTREDEGEQGEVEKEVGDRSNKKSEDRELGVKQELAKERRTG
jgi:hypothetical protein